MERKPFGGHLLEYKVCEPSAGAEESIRRPLTVVLTAGVILFLIMAAAVLPDFRRKAERPSTSGAPGASDRTISSFSPRATWTAAQPRPEASPDPSLRSIPAPLTLLPPLRSTATRATRSLWRSSRPAEAVQRAAPAQPLPPAVVSQAPPAALPPKEVVIPLDQWNSVTTEYGSFSIRVHDHGVLTVTVWIDYGAGRRVEKQKGFETTSTNIVQIHTLVRAKVYYVDRIAVESGHCVLKIVPQA